MERCLGGLAVFSFFSIVLGQYLAKSEGPNSREVKQVCHCLLPGEFSSQLFTEVSNLFVIGLRWLLRQQTGWKVAGLNDGCSMLVDLVNR